MSLLKKNLAFTAIVVVCVLVFAAGAYLAFSQSKSIEKATQQIRTAKLQLDNVRNANPAPTEANVEASRQNVVELSDALKEIRADLQRGARLTTTSDGISVMAGIQQYISEYQQKASSHVQENGEPSPISVPNDFAFGFEQYITKATPLDDADRSAVLDKQRQILSYLLDKLFAADPESIVSVKREALERPAAEKSNDKNFKISPAVSARVPGAIDTLAFSLAFTGYTDSLREFLNNLAKFDLPIVVRSIEVERPSGSATTAPAPTNNNSLDAIFGAMGGGTNEPEETQEAQKPVISENISTFTVVLEFIEIVLPAEPAEDNV
jgi:hypothetical protein